MYWHPPTVKTSISGLGISMGSMASTICKAVASVSCKGCVTVQLTSLCCVGRREMYRTAIGALVAVIHGAKEAGAAEGVPAGCRDRLIQQLHAHATLCVVRLRAAAPHQPPLPATSTAHPFSPSCELSAKIVRGIIGHRVLQYALVAGPALLLKVLCKLDDAFCHRFWHGSDNVTASVARYRH